MFDFMKYRYLYFVISLLVIIPGLVSLFRYGLVPSIDFTGGSLLEVQFVAPATQPSSESIEQTLQKIYVINSVQSSGSEQFIIRGQAVDNSVKDSALLALQNQYGPLQELRFETVGPVLGRELLSKTLLAIGLAAVLIAIYVAHQFSELKYGICAILAMSHDSLVLLGIFSLLGHFMGVEVDVLFVTALLTTLSFSVHDTIVVYDRIREFRKKYPRFSLHELTNAAVLQTLSRSLNNSITIIIMLLALVLLGGETIRWFALALLIGAVTGTYSSTFTAAPLLLVWDSIAQKVTGRTKK